MHGISVKKKSKNELEEALKSGEIHRMSLKEIEEMEKRSEPISQST